MVGSLDQAPISVEQFVFLDVVVTPQGRDLLTRQLVDEALGRPLTRFAGELLYSTPFARAAAMMESLIAKRRRSLAALAGAFWLEREGYRLEAEPADLVQTVQGVAAGALDMDALAHWLDTNSRPM